MTKLLSTRKNSTLILLLIVIAVGFSIRYDNLSFWKENKSIYFLPSGNTPLTLNLDSYYYLDIASDLLQGTVKKLDHQRQAPHWYEKPVSLPLLSLILATVSKVSGASLEWSAILLPPFLAVLLAIPVYLLSVLLCTTSSYGKTNDNMPVYATIAGLAAALFALLSPAFVERSSIGWCDTDILNVTLLCSLTLVSLYVARARETRELILALLLFTFLSGFFLFWWDQATGVIAGFSLGYLFLAGLFNIIRKKNNAKFFIAFLVVITLILFGLKGKSVIQLPASLWDLILYTFSSDAQGVHFINPGQLVAEQQDISFSLLATNIAGNGWIFSIAILGIVLLVLISKQYFLFLLPWVILSFLAIKSHRTMIFPSVLLGLGIGTIVFLACTHIKKPSVVKLFPILAAILACAWFPYTQSQSLFSRAPNISPQFFGLIKKNIPSLPVGSTIWASWGHGHPLVFYTDARTIGDGIFHPPALVYTQYVPYASSSPRLTANWISFYSTHGMDGLRKCNKSLVGSSENWSEGMPALQSLLGSGVEKTRTALSRQYNFSPRETEEFLSFLYPSPTSPVYFLLDYVAFEQQWYSWGRMNLQHTGKNISYTQIPIYAASQSGKNLKARTPLGLALFDLISGRGNIKSDETIFLRQVRIDNGRTLFNRSYASGQPGSPASHTLLINQNKYMTFGTLIDSQVLNTIFTKMFFLKEYDANFFQPIFDASPLMSLYQVTGEVYRESK